MGARVNICAVLLLVYLVGQVCSGYVRTFRCNNNGKYIRDDFFCDGDRDCPSREDEGQRNSANSSCQRTSCGRAKFACDGGQCKNITVRCNTLNDCNDGTDELNCGDEVNTKNCTSKDKFLCHDGLRCLDIDLTCNGDCNCFDCSDESSNCSKSDASLLKRCPKGYFVGANGPLCLCEPNESESNPICNAIESCPDHYGCEQYCIRYKSAKRCSCYEGYHPSDGKDGSRCKSDDWFGNVIVYSTTLKIKSLNVTSNKSTTVQSAVHLCTALTAANNNVYYATLLSNNRGGLFKSPLASRTSDGIQIVQTDFPITSIAVDYATNNVYFTSNGSLSVCSSDGRICQMLKCCGINYVAIAPKSGSLFYLQLHSLYSENGNILMKANMDGSNETIFADDVYRTANISIVIDESKSKLYLLESNNKSRVKIHQLSFDGEFKESVTTPNPGIHSLTALNGDVFFTYYQQNDIMHSSILRSLRSINNDADFYYRDNSTSSAKYLFAYNAKLQRQDENPCSKSSCSGLCLIKPTISTSLSYTCLCNDFTPTNDNHWCSNLPVQTASHGIIWAVLGISVLMILAGTGYYMFHKRDWYGYYLALRQWERSRRDQRIISD